jgi:hypothetical protein
MGYRAVARPATVHTRLPKGPVTRWAVYPLRGLLQEAAEVAGLPRELTSAVFQRQNVDPLVAAHLDAAA